MIQRRSLLTGAAAGALLAVTGCTADERPPGPQPPNSTETPRIDPRANAVLTRTPAGDLVVPSGPEGALVASRAVLAAATVVVVVGAAADASPHATAARLARELGIPAFVDAPGLAAELDRLQTRTVLAYGTPQHVGGRASVAAPATAAEVDLPGLPARAEAPPVLALVSGPLDPLTDAVLSAAGVPPALTLIGPHPGVTAESTARVRAHRGPLLAVGEGFGTDQQFAGQVEVTRTAAELPGGGIAPFPGRHMIALYGHPETAGLGMLGEQPPAEAVTRLNRLVEEYRAQLPGQTVVGSFEIIATVASAGAGEDGDYSYETPAELLLPWIEAAEENDIYVVLDLQPGRTSFLEQAKRYAELLKRPGVGLALDPEWRLKPNQKHLRQIGQVQVDEVNEVGAWLADLVAEHRLPPKVLTLHQFQTRMIVDRARLDTSRPEIQYLVHVDGQGGQGAKQDTWKAIKRDLPPHTHLGWKNFEDEDLPMLTPRETIEQVHPTPQFISYQ